MSVPNNSQWEAQKVKELGEQIGYGNMMQLASALWRKMLIEKCGLGTGAFVPRLIDKREKLAIKEYEFYDEIVKDI